MRPHSTLSTMSAFRRGDVLRIDTGPDAELVKVTGCTGVGPYTVAVRRYRWHDRAWAWLRVLPKRLAEPVAKPLRRWRYQRCEAHWCLRKATLETTDYDEYCERHAPADARPLERWDGNDD